VWQRLEGGDILIGKRTPGGQFSDQQVEWIFFGGHVVAPSGREHTYLSVPATRLDQWESPSINIGRRKPPDQM
jgi:hypothetical protein